MITVIAKLTLAEALTVKNREHIDFPTILLTFFKNSHAMLIIRKYCTFILPFKTLSKNYS
jgi:hypothetical protein